MGGANGGPSVEIFHLRIELTDEITFNTKARPIRFYGTVKEDHFVIDMCPICMNHEEAMVTKSNRGEYYITGCKHVFCRKCLDEHKQTDRKCPLCRQEKLDVNNEQESLFEELVQANPISRKRKSTSSTSSREVMDIVEGSSTSSTDVEDGGNSNKKQKRRDSDDGSTSEDNSSSEDSDDETNDLED